MGIFANLRGGLIGIIVFAMITGCVKDDFHTVGNTEAWKSDIEEKIQVNPAASDTQYHGILLGPWENLTQSLIEFGIADLLHDTLTHSHEAIDIAVFGTPPKFGAVGSYMGTNEELLKVPRGGLQGFE